MGFGVVESQSQEKRRRRRKRWWGGTGISKWGRAKPVVGEDSGEGGGMEEGVVGGGGGGVSGEGVFEGYYRALGLLDGLKGKDGEWDLFLASLSQPLPVTFRYASSPTHTPATPPPCCMPAHAQQATGSVKIRAMRSSAARSCRNHCRHALP